MHWKQQFEIIEKILRKKFSEEGRTFTYKALEDELDVSRGKVNHWKKGQRPSADDLEKISLKYGFSPSWLLLRVGKPLEDCELGEFNPDLVHIGDTLHDMVLGDFGDDIEAFALEGGMTPPELYACMGSRLEIPSTAVRKWVRRYRVNANFLLAQIGRPFLTKTEFEQPGPLDWAKPRFEREEEELEKKEERPTTTQAVPETQLGKELADIKAVLRELDTPEAEIRQTIMDYLAAGKGDEKQDLGTGTDDHDSV